MLDFGCDLSRVCLRVIARCAFLTQKERDNESGLDFFKARYYSSMTGRFTSIDPINVTKERMSDPQTFNLYCYVRNNPLLFVDPDGLDLVVGHKTLKQAVSTFLVLKRGLEKGDRKYVRLIIGNGKNGFAKGEFGVRVDPNHQSQSGNFQSVQKIANDTQDRAVVRTTGSKEDIAANLYQGVQQSNGSVTAVPMQQFLTQQGVNPPSYVLKNAEGGEQVAFPLNKPLIDGAQYTSGNEVQVMVAPDGSIADRAAVMYHGFRHVSESDMGRNLPSGTHGLDPNFTGPNKPTGVDKDAEDEARKNAKKP